LKAGGAAPHGRKRKKGIQKRAFYDGPQERGQLAHTPPVSKTHSRRRGGGVPTETGFLPQNKSGSLKGVFRRNGPGENRKEIWRISNKHKDTTSPDPWHQKGNGRQEKQERGGVPPRKRDVTLERCKKPMQTRTTIVLQVGQPGNNGGGENKKEGGGEGKVSPHGELFEGELKIDP